MPPSAVNTTMAEAVVDIGIPTLGASPFLVESIESVMAQTMSSWRLVIWENGLGLESTRQTLEPYLRDPRVRHVVTGTKVSVGQNHTNVITAGTAPYVGILHDDDRWGREFLERRVDFLEQNQGCGFVYSGTTIIDDSGTALGRTKLPLAPGVQLSAVILPLLYRNNFVGVPTVVVVRRSAYEAVGSAFKEILFIDVEMWLRLSARFDVGCLDLWDADWRIHAAQTSANRTQFADVWFPLLDAAESLPLSRSLQKAVRAEAHVLSALDAVERGERRSAVRHLVCAVRTDAREMTRPRVGARVLAAVAALSTGAYGRKKLTAVRERRWRAGRAEGLLPPQSTQSVSPSSRESLPHG